MPNPFPRDEPLYNWDLLRIDDVPSAEYRYETDNTVDSVTALRECEQDLQRLLQRLPVERDFAVQFKVRYSSQGDSETAFVESDVVNVRLPLSNADWMRLSNALHNDVDEWYQSCDRVEVVYLLLWDKKVGDRIILDNETRADAKKRKDREERDREKQQKRQRQQQEERRRKVSEQKRITGARRVGHAGNQGHRKQDARALLRALALAMHPRMQPTSKEVTESIEDLLNAVSDAVPDAIQEADDAVQDADDAVQDGAVQDDTVQDADDAVQDADDDEPRFRAIDEPRFRAIEKTQSLAITVWDHSSGETTRPPFEPSSDFTPLNVLWNSADQEYLALDDVGAYLKAYVQYSEHPCGNPHCTYQHPDRREVAKHEARCTCVKCPQCKRTFKDAGGFDTSLAARDEHVRDAASDPSLCIAKQSLDKNGEVRRVSATPLPAPSRGHTLVVDLEAIPSHGDTAVGVAIKKNDAGDVLPIDNLVSQKRSLKICYADETTTFAAACPESDPTNSVVSIVWQGHLTESPARKRMMQEQLRGLKHGDIFTVNGLRFVNKIGADRTTAGEQLVTMACFHASPDLAKIIDGAPSRERELLWERTAPNEYRTTYREEEDGKPLLDLEGPLDAAIGFLDHIDELLRTNAERGARWYARCTLLNEWCYCSEGRERKEFDAWAKGKTLTFWKKYEQSHVNPKLLAMGVLPNNNKTGTPRVDQNLDVEGEGAGVDALFAWLWERREQYNDLVQKKLSDVSNDKVTLLAHNGAGYDYYKLLRALLQRGCADKTKLLVNQGKLISLQYGRFTFHDTMLQIAGGVSKLAKDFRAPDDGQKGVAPHGWYATTEDRERNWPNVDFTGKPAWWRKWSNEDLEYKPARRFFVEPSDVKTANGVKVEGLALTISPEEYAKIPGKDPEGRHDGPIGSKWNSFAYFATYCAQDCRVLYKSIWAKWTAAVIGTTCYDGRDEAHCVLASNHNLTVLSIDPGWSTGYCLVRLDADGKWHVERCGTLTCVTPDNACAKLRAALGGATYDVALIELQPYFDPENKDQCLVETEQWRRMEALERGFDCARVDSGYPKHLDDDAGSGHKEHKAWALKAAPRVAEARGVTLPPDLTDDACDAFLQAAWWIEKHTAPCAPRSDSPSIDAHCLCAPCSDSPSIDAHCLCAPRSDSPSIDAHCLCCVRRFGTRGVDPSSRVTISQLTTSAYKTKLSCEVPPEKCTDDETGIVTYKRRYAHRPRYMPRDGIASLPRAEDQMCRAAMRGGRTETGALLYEIENPCRCPVDKTTGRHVWSDKCWKKPTHCPKCGSSDVRVHDKGVCACGGCQRLLSVPERIESWDVTSLYPSCLLGDLPVPNGECLTPDKIAKLDPDTFLFSDDGEKYYWIVTCDIVANPTDVYPMLSTRRAVVEGGAQKLVFDNLDVTARCECGATPPCYVPHGPTCKHQGCEERCHGQGDTCAAHAGVASSRCARALTVCCPELRIALREGGCRITKIHRAIRYEKADYMRSYIEDWAAIKQKQDEYKDAIPLAKEELKRCRKGLPRDLKSLNGIGIALDALSADIDRHGVEAAIEKRLHECETAYNPAMRAAAKLILNSIYGRTLMRERDSETLLMTTAQRNEWWKNEENKARFLTEDKLHGVDAWVIVVHKAWQPARGLPPVVGVFCLSLSKVVLWKGVKGCIEAGGTWLGGDTDCVTVALPHGVEFPVELQGGEFGKYTRDYAELLITGYGNPILKGLAYRFEHAFGRFVAAACGALRDAIATWGDAAAEARTVLRVLEETPEAALGEELARNGVRAALVSTIQSNWSESLTHALLDVMGPETMRLKGARVNDNLPVLSYATYADLAAGERTEVEVTKRQLLKRGWCAQEGQAFTRAGITIQGKSDKRRTLKLEPPIAELPPGQLPKPGIRRRLTVPWNYEPLPTTDAQLRLCRRAAPEKVTVQTVADVHTLPDVTMDALKRVWAEVRRDPLDRYSDKPRRDALWAVLTGADLRTIVKALLSSMDRNTVMDVLVQVGAMDHDEDSQKRADHAIHAVLRKPLMPRRDRRIEPFQYRTTKARDKRTAAVLVRAMRRSAMATVPQKGHASSAVLAWVRTAKGRGHKLARDRLR